MGIQMAENEFAAALSMAGATPCEKFACPSRQTCADEKKACSSFRHFVVTGRALDPHIVVPPKVTAKIQPQRHSEIFATRRMYESAMAA